MSGRVVSMPSVLYVGTKSGRFYGRPCGDCGEEILDLKAYSKPSTGGKTKHYHLQCAIRVGFDYPEVLEAFDSLINQRSLS